VTRLINETSMNKEPEKTFLQRRDDFADQHNKYRIKYNRISWVRIIMFLLFGGVILLLLSREMTEIGLFVVLLFIPLFLVIVKWHERTGSMRNFYTLLSEINNEELQRLDHQFQDLDPGIEFAREEHPYAIDLDIFGRNSIFQLLNRTETADGRQTLARWLSSKAEKNEVLVRQSAVLELTKELDFRQKLQASGRLSKRKKTDLKPFLEWLQTPVRYLHHHAARAAALVVPGLSIMIIILTIIGIAHQAYLLLPIIITGSISALLLPYTNIMYRQTSQAVIKLQSYYKMILLIEQSGFNDKRLCQLKSVLMEDGQVASTRIRRLSQILDFFTSRANMLYWIFNAFFLTDLLIVLYAEQWKERSGKKVNAWFDAVAAYESLASIAAYSFAHPEYATPKILDKPYTLAAKSVGHPLIPKQERVCNDFMLEGKGNIAIVTGSNMAGKSTFLRTIGLNIVLAFSGAPVCADSIEISDFKVFTSMRTKDNLEEHVSSFYAELIRIKHLLEYIEDDRTAVFFFLDEILKGTNSLDRHRGSQALLNQLSTTNATGLVSTHDLELGKMADGSKGFKNFSFNSFLKDDQLKFDYLLKPGICESFNASLLMARMGIKIDPDNN